MKGGGDQHKRPSGVLAKLGSGQDRIGTRPSSPGRCTGRHGRARAFRNVLDSRRISREGGVPECEASHPGSRSGVAPPAVRCCL
eukprot:4913948-Pyramimonas_sp.AAC.1